MAIALQLTRTSQQAQVDALKQFQKENYKVVREYMETYRGDLTNEILESQKYRIRAFLIPKIGNHAKTSELAIEFINANNLTEEERETYEQGITFIKGIESPFKLKPKRVVELVKEKHAFFNMTTHTKCWKYFNARPAVNAVGFKGAYAGFIEGFDGYLYSQHWVAFLIKELSDKVKLKEVQSIQAFNK
ncbi:hypothetical protein [Pseudaeromonas pectinilytica]